jgi:hypothetical protein
VAKKGAAVNKRRGRVKAGAGGGPAQFETGPAAAPKVFDAERVAGELRLYWENGDGGSYLIHGENGSWSTWPETKVKVLLRRNWVSSQRRDGNPLTEVEEVLLWVMEHRRVELSMPALAGYPSGIHELWGQRVVVKTSPRLVVPAKGEWPVVKKLIEGLLNEGEGGHDQVPYFHGWMKIALEGLYLGGVGNFRPGHACIFSGPRNSGKSRLQHQIVTALLGGRSADPGPYMFGRTDFNGEMLGSEHLMMEDPATSTLTKDRVFFGEMIKQIVVNDTQRLHAKREDALTVSPFWRLTISVNDDPDKMRVLPLLTPDLKDKIMLFHVGQKELPMPTTTLEERAAFRAAVAAELPAYAHWLLHEHVIAEEISATRFGVREWQHPELAKELFEDTPAAEMLMLIDVAVFESGEFAEEKKLKLWQLAAPVNQYKDPQGRPQHASRVWKGSAIDLERVMMGDMPGITSSVSKEAKKLFAHNKCDRLLSRLKEDRPDRVQPMRTKHARLWSIGAPSGEG